MRLFSSTDKKLEFTDKFLGECTHAHVEDRGQCQVASSVAVHFFEIESFLEPGTHPFSWTGCPTSSRNLPVCFPDMIQHSNTFDMGAKNLNSEPHTCLSK